ncbi:autotransporter-associated beta strand repeat-containing protein [Pseudomonas sp. Irchel s3b5]|uniref:autotransporter-associated beta strand repeat-containing protein n=1 Tax=Pseudomonas sp. Irchel s3b5 TaxID=2009077 RepID=UPI000BA2C524|nr:autotransporter-associated beta strand repeat-containing protein [Pseudomonas sp. Irchel s3b5]
MNHVFSLVWNASLGCWAVTHEFSKRCRKGSRRTGKLALAAMLLGTGFSSTAFATCSTAGSTVTCTGVPSLPLFLNNFSSAANGLTVNVNSGAQMNATLGGHVMDLTGVNISLNNSGTIDPALLGLVSVLSGGAFIGTGASSTVSVLNNASGIIRGTGMLLGLNLTSIDGLGIAVNNAATGTTSITNNGTITSTGLLGSGITLADTPVVGVYGGSQVNMTNSSTGVINGRIAFETSAAGNTFTNAGAITGGVSMGANSTNTFTAVTGSSVQVGDGTQVSEGLGGLIGINLTFAPTGTVDGGAGGTNSLILQNPIGVGGGTTGVGTASSSTYVNFNNLTINSGTWTLQGPLISGATTLNGGIAQFNNNATFGSGVVTSNGGILQASSAGLNISNLISLGAGGVTVQGSNDTTLSGVISGSGGLTKIGSSQLNLSAANIYLGNTTLNGGTVKVGNNQAFSTGNLLVAGASTLNSSSAETLNNNVILNANLTAGGANALTLGGVISGGNGLIKSGASSLTLKGNNTYTGTTALTAGSLVVGSNTALGTGALNASNGTSLDANTAATLTNNVNLAGTLTLGGTNALTLGGSVAGIGGLVKNGAANLTLNGANTYFGNTALNSGKLIVGSNTALGSGTLNAAAETTLDANTAISLNNAVALAGALNVGGTANLTLTGLVSGAGSLVKNGAANLILNAANNYLGGTTLNTGTLTVGNSSALGTGALTVAGAATLDSNSPLVTLSNGVALNAALTVDGTQNLTLGGVTSGNGQLIKNGAANLTLNGNNTFSGGTALNGGTLTLGNANGLGSGGLIVGGAATLDNSASFGIGNAITLNAGLTVAGNNDLSLNGIIDGAGSLTKNGLADLTLAGNNTFTGALNIVSGSVTTLNTNALGATSGVNISAGAGLNLGSDASLGALSGSGSVQLTGSNTLTVGLANSTSTFDGDLSGSGGLTKVGTGTLNLTGINGITGNSAINGGTVDLSGSLASAQVSVNTGGTLTGTGSALGTVNVNNGGHLGLSSGNQLSASGLTLAAGSSVDVVLGTPSTTSLMNVGGNLTLNGNLNVTDAGGFGVGVYRLFNYTGALTNLGLDVASAPVGYGLGDLVVQTGVANQINIQVSAPNVNIRYWDGSQTIANGVVDGGSGTWNASGTNWTDANGLVNQPWAGDFAVFQGAAGTVTVNGTQLFNGMQFLTDGYNLVNGASGQLTAVNGTGGTTAVRVDPGVTGTIGVNINGGGILNKLDAGTLVLNGANTYTGGTQLDGGRIVVGSNTALGSGTLTANAGTQLDSNTAVTLGNAATLNGNLTVLGSNALTLNGVIGGTGGVIKNGATNLTLGGNNAFLGPVALNAGGLILASNSAVGSGTLNAAGGTTLDASTQVSVNNAVNLAGNLGIGGTADLSLNGTVNGAGSLTKNGAANLILSGNNNFLGGISLNAGTLTAGSNSALGLGNLTVAGTSALDSNSALSLGNNVVLNANLSNTGSNNLTLAGVVSGAGGLIKNGASNLTLNGINTYSGGTTLSAGTVTLGTGASLGSGALTVAGSSTLDNSAPQVLANNVNVNANLALAGNNNLTLGGVIAGAGTLTKNGLADVTLSGNNSFSGTFDVLSGSLTTLSGAALGNNSTVNLGGGAALNLAASGRLASLTGSGTALIGTGNTLSLGGNNVSSTFAGILSGDGGLTKLGSGTQTLSGISDLTGDTHVNAGTLQVNGSLDSANVLINSGGTLGGSGTLGGAVTVTDGGHLALASGSALSVASLVLDDHSNLDVGLSAPVVGGGSALLNVGGNLTLDGNLNVSDIGGFGSGVYRVINYSGGLTDNGLLIGSVPGSVTPGDLQLQTNIGNQINLLVTAQGVTVQFWDGAQQIADGSINGGNGTWGSGNTNWTTVDGTLNLPWANSFAVFQGTAGSVTVDGTQTITGLQFVTDGYGLQNGSAGVLNLVNGSLGNTTVRVDPNTTATLGVALNGSGTLGKYDAGTLVLNAASGYTGGTVLNGGKLVVGNDAALGSGALTAADGTVLDSNSAVSLGNDVVLNGGLNVAGSNALTLNGLVSGAGTLNKTGAANLTLNGSNSYSGGTALNGGTLVLGNNTALGSGALLAAGGTALDSNSAVTLANDVALNGALNLAGSNALTLGGVVSGAGSLIKNGASSLTLNGNNSYSGGTVLNGGTLVLGNNAALGSGALLAAGGTTLDSNTAVTLANDVALNGGLNLTGSNALSLGGVVSGTGSLIKNGASSLTLNGNNSYSGGTALNGGTLVLGNNAALGSGALVVANGTTLDSSNTANLANSVDLNGSLTLAGSHDLTLSGVISGNGDLNKQGASELTLSGNNTFGGALNVLDGSLSLIGNTALGNADLNVASTASVSIGGLNNLDALSGSGVLALAAGSTLQVGAAGASSVYEGSISGAGHLTKVGTGKQVLNGNSTIGGGTTVAGGSLIIGGAAGSSASLASDVDVTQGAMLGGHGTIIGDVSLASGATLNPGNSIGTLKVDGNLSLNSGSTLVIEADPDGRSDRVIASGTVSLGGANLSVLAGTGTWSPTTQYNIIQAASLNGTFGSVSSNLAFLTPQVSYASNGATLLLKRNDVAFTSVAQTYNQRAVAGSLDAAGAGGVYDAVAALSADQARLAYDSVSGEIHASTRSALFDDSRYVRNAIGTRLRSAQGQALSEGVLHVDADSGMTFWVQGYGSWGDSDGNHNVADLDHNSQGVLLGIDMPLNDTWRAGLAAGYGNTDLDADARNSSAKVDSTSLTAYLGGQWDALHLRVGASHAWNDIDSSRHVQVGSLGEHVKADYDASTSQVFGELGYAVQAADVTLEPFVGLAHVEVDSDSFSEHGGITALSSDSEKERATYSSLGLRASTPAAVVAGVPLSVQSSLAWQHVLDEPTDNSRLTLAGYDSFSVKGVSVAQDTALVQFGVSAKLAPQASLDLGYSGQIGDGYSDHGVRLGLNISF